MVSSREVIDLAVCVLDAVEDPNLPASQMFDAAVHASMGADATAGSPAVPARQQTTGVQYDLLAAEVQPLIAALERHLQRMRAWRSTPIGDSDPAFADPDSGQAQGDPGLTTRETEALILLSRGFTARATARRMGCATSTANKHLGNVYRKLGVGDRLGAVLEAQRRGILGGDALLADGHEAAQHGPVSIAGIGFAAASGPRAFPA